MSAPEWISCHDCDLVHRAPEVPVGGAALCTRCGATLFKHRRDPLDRTLALTVAGLVLLAVANTFPFLTFQMRGSQTETTLGTGVVDLYQQGMPELAGLVLLTAILAPAVHLGMLLHLTLPLRLGRVPWGLNPSFRLMRRIQPWSMMEVFMLGILVSVVKLAAMGRIVPGLALYAFGVLILVLAAANASFDPRSLWRRVEELS